MTDVPPTPDPPARRARRPLSKGKKAAFAGFTLVLLFGLGEVAVRIVDRARGANPASHDPRTTLYRADPFMQVVLKPGAELIDPEQTFRINRLGFRGPEIEAKKPAGTLRVICVGASTTFGHSAKDDASTWPRILEGKLRQALPGKTVEVINAGVPGYTTFHNLPNLALRLLPLEPDAVVIYHGTNDLAQWKKLQADPTRYRIVRPKRVKHSLWANLKSKSLLYLVARNRIQRWQKEHVGAPTGPLSDTVGEAGPAAFRRNLTSLVALTSAAKVPVVLSTFASRYVETPDEAERQRAWVDMHLTGLSYEGLRSGHAAYNAVVRDVATTTRAPLVEAAQALSGKPEHFTDSVHLTDLARHDLAKQVLAKLLPLLPDLTPR